MKAIIPDAQFPGEADVELKALGPDAEIEVHRAVRAEDIPDSSWADCDAILAWQDITVDAELVEKLNHRFATLEEVNKAREAATPGSVNKWTANRPVLPRNLPGKVNEFGFDTERTPSDSARYWWVIEQQQ